LIVYILTGCADTGVDLHTGAEDEYLIRVADRVTTADDFSKSFEILKTAYSHNSLRDNDLLKDIKLRLLNQMIEEMILLERAEEINIRLSDAEVEKAVADVKADYDGAVFEHTLPSHTVCGKRD